MTASGSTIAERSGVAVFEQLAEWALAGMELPDTVVTNAKLGILDLIAVSLAARSEPIVDVLAAVTPAEVSTSLPTVVGQAMSAPPQFSAFVNGALAHALDFDDSSADLGGHPSAVVLPAALAAAQATGASGRELLEAYCVGVEVTCALGRALNPAHYDSGWHPTATLGAFGATAAAGRLLGLSPDRLAQSFGMTAALASGIKASFGTLAKPLQVGRAAMNGIASVELIQAGASARATAFEATQGFLATYQRTGSPVPVVLPGTAAQGWSLATPGLIIKRYPCCGSTHSAIEAAQEVREQLGPREIDWCEVRVHPRRVGHVDRPDPQSALDCKFSLQYTVARALLAGGVRLQDFEGDSLWHGPTRSLMTRISVGVLDVGDELPEDRFVAEVAAGGRGAGDVRARVPMASGRVPGEMLAADAFWEKFENCCSRALSPERSNSLRRVVLSLEDLTSADTLVEACLPDVAVAS